MHTIGENLRVGSTGFKDLNKQVLHSIIPRDAKRENASFIIEEDPYNKCR